MCRNNFRDRSRGTGVTVGRGCTGSWKAKISLMSDTGAERMSPGQPGRKGLSSRGNGTCKVLEKGGAKDGKLAPPEMGNHLRLLNRAMALSFFLFKISALRAPWRRGCRRPGQIQGDP